MIYLSGVATPELRAGERADVGLMAQPRSCVTVHLTGAMPWAADNGVFGDWIKGRPFNTERWWRWVRTLDVETQPLFVVVPDVPADQAETTRLARVWANRVRELGFRTAIAAQNGYHPDTFPWDLADAVFLGGDTPWKMAGGGAMAAAFDAKARGKWVHMGRVNSAARLRWAAECACDSADGTFLRFGPPAEMWARLLAWLDSLGRTPVLPAGHPIDGSGS